LLYREAMPILVCTLWDYHDPVQLLLHRMEHVTITADAVEPLLGFDLDAWIAEREFDYRLSEHSMALEVVFDAVAAVRVIETPLANNQHIETLPDGRVHLYATVPDTMQLRHWLRGFGPLVEVLAPSELRADMAEQAARTAARYRASLPAQVHSSG